MITDESGRDATWWEVHRRTARSQGLAKALEDYLCGRRPFEVTVLDALEDRLDGSLDVSECAECDRRAEEEANAEGVGAGGAPRDALWWQVHRRTACHTDLEEALSDYLRGLRPFHEVVLDALEEALEDADLDPDDATCEICERRDADEDDAEDLEFVRTHALEEALTQYRDGEAADVVLMGLLNATLGSLRLAGLDADRLRGRVRRAEAQVAQRQAEIARRHTELRAFEEALMADQAGLEDLRRQLAALPADTSCPSADTPCPSADTSCPSADTSYPSADTSCPKEP